MQRFDPHNVFLKNKLVKMKNLIVPILVCFLSISAVNILAQSTREISNFDRISVSSSVKVELIKADAPKLEYKMTSGSDEKLITEVKNNRLIIKIKNGMFNRNNNTKANVKVYYTSLSGIELSAGSAVKSSGTIKSDKLIVDASSGARADLDVEAAAVGVEASSGSKVSIDGSAEKGKFEVSSGANINASNLICEKVKAEASSGGQIRAHVDKELTAEASSGGTIRYKGSVEYTNTDSGWSGQISRMK